MFKTISGVALFLVATSVAPTEARVYSACGVHSTESFNNFFQQIDSYAPLVYPKNDAELSNILKKARKFGCTVRPKGTGHSGNGVVAQKTEPKMIVVSLAEYRLDDEDAEWSSILNEETLRYRAEAGKTFLDLISDIRPKGYLLPTQTAGWFFSLGGVYMNPSVHGSGHTGQHLMAYVTGVRAMLADGSISYITEEAELQKWRGSLGMLGIVTALEVEVRPDTGVALSSASVTLPDFERETFMGFVDDVVTNNDHSTVFYSVYTDAFVALTAKNSGGPPSNLTQIAELYEATKASLPNLAKDGSPIGPPEDTAYALNGGQTNRPLAEAVATAVLPVLGFIWEANVAQANDMFWLSSFNNVYEEVSMLIPYENFYDAFMAFRKLGQDLINDPDADFYLNQGSTFRIVNVPETRKSIWQSLKPGRYVALEQIHVPDPSLNVHVKWFGEFERKMIELGGVPHQGKGFAVDQLGDLPTPSFFQSQQVYDTIYPEEATRQACLNAMNEYDPNGLFRGGATLQALGQDDAVSYEPRSLLLGSCDYFGNAECVSGCCYSLPSWLVESGKGCVPSAVCDFASVEERSEKSEAEASMTFGGIGAAVGVVVGVGATVAFNAFRSSTNKEVEQLDVLDTANL